MKKLVLFALVVISFVACKDESYNPDVLYNEKDMWGDWNGILKVDYVKQNDSVLVDYDTTYTNTYVTLDSLNRFIYYTDGFRFSVLKQAFWDWSNSKNKFVYRENIETSEMYVRELTDSILRYDFIDEYMNGPEYNVIHTQYFYMRPI